MLIPQDDLSVLKDKKISKCKTCLSDQKSGTSKGYFFARNDTNAGTCYNQTEHEGKVCTGDGQHICSWLPENKTHLGIKNDNAEAPDSFMQALYCPNNRKCENRGSKVIDLSLRETDAFIKMNDTEVLLNDEFCAYWIQPTY